MTRCMPSSRMTPTQPCVRSPWLTLTEGSSTGPVAVHQALNAGNSAKQYLTCLAVIVIDRLVPVIFTVEMGNLYKIAQISNTLSS